MSSNIMSDLFVYMSSVENELNVKFNKIDSLRIARVESNRFVQCSYYQGNSLIKSKVFPPTVENDDLISFCVGASIVEQEDGTLLGISADVISAMLNSLIEVLTQRASPLPTVNTLGNILAKESKPVTWVFDGVSITFDVTDIGIDVTSNSTNEYCQSASFAKDDPLLDIVAFMTQCTVTGRGDNGAFISSQVDILQKLFSVLQHPS